MCWRFSLCVCIVAFTVIGTFSFLSVLVRVSVLARRDYGEMSHVPRTLISKSSGVAVGWYTFTSGFVVLFLNQLRLCQWIGARFAQTLLTRAVNGVG